MMEYQRSLVQEIESRLERKCDTLADIFAADEIGMSYAHLFLDAWDMLLVLLHLLHLFVSVQQNPLPLVRFLVLGFQKGSTLILFIQVFFFFLSCFLNFLYVKFAHIKAWRDSKLSCTCARFPQFTWAVPTLFARYFQTEDVTSLFV